MKTTFPPTGDKLATDTLWNFAKKGISALAVMAMLMGPASCEYLDQLMPSDEEEEEEKKPGECEHDNWGPWEETKEPTCEEDGVITRICQDDPNHVQTASGKPAIGHDWGEMVRIDPTCEVIGSETYTCQNDASHQEVRSLHALGHNFQYYFSNGDATYEADGTKTATCERDNCYETETVRDVGSKLINPIENVEFPTIDPNWTEQSAIAELLVITGKLSDQSQTLCNHFVKSPGNVPGNTIVEIFNILTSMGADYQVGSIELIKDSIPVSIGSMTDVIGEYLWEPGTRELFNAHLDAFQKAHVLAQREHWGTGDQANAEAAFAEAVAAIEQLGGATNIPTDDVNQAITMLKQALQTSIPNVIGDSKFRNGLVQQWEDYAQFDGWTADLQELGFELTRQGGQEITAGNAGVSDAMI